MDKEKLKEIKDKTVRVAKDEFNNMKSATSDVKEAIKNKNLDNIKSKDSKSKKKFYLGVAGIIIIILFIIGLFSDDENSSSSENNSKSMCSGKYYYVRMEKGEPIEKCSSKCWYTDNVPMCSWGLFGMETYTVEYFEDRTDK